MGSVLAYWFPVILKFGARLLIYSAMEKDVRCPRCVGAMTFQGVQSVGAGVARISNVEVYLCPKCGCVGRYDEKVLKVIEIR